MNRFWLFEGVQLRRRQSDAEKAFKIGYCESKWAISHILTGLKKREVLVERGKCLFLISLNRRKYKSGKIIKFFSNYKYISVNLIYFNSR